MRLSLDIKHDENYYYINRARLEKDIVKNVYESKQWKQWLKDKNIFLTVNEYDKNHRKHIAAISSINLDEHYLEIYDDTIDDAYKDILQGNVIVKISAIINRKILHQVTYSHINFTLKQKL